jgi:hypothetical protein
LARCLGYRLDLFFFRLLGFPIAFLLTLGHVALSLLVDDKQVSVLPDLVSYRDGFSYIVS